MPVIFILCSILIPWLGAIVVWLTGDRNPRISTCISCSIRHFGGSLFNIHVNKY